MYYLTLTYDDNWLREGQYAELLRYGPDAQRWVTTDSIGGQVSAVTHYHGDFEMRSTSTGGVSMYHYLGNGLLCVTIANSQPLYYYMMTDNIGSVVHVVNGEGISEFDAWYDAWGRQTVSANGIGFFRGYGGHEMLPQFRLVNMDGRMYDYVLGRFLSPDNYVQEPENSQSFNRYSYCLNNPLKYTDPSGSSFILAFAIGGAIGAYCAGMLANDGKMDPREWDHSSKTWRYMIAGAFAGSMSGAIGSEIASSGIPFANTISMVFSSEFNSAVTNMYTGLTTHVSIGFGFFSYDFTDRKLNYLGKNGNSGIENFSYLMGGLGNLSDILIGTNPQKVDIVTNYEDFKGHTAIVKNGMNKEDYGYDIPDGALIPNADYLINSHGKKATIVSIGPDNVGKFNSFVNAHSYHTNYVYSDKPRWINTVFANQKSLINYSNWINRLASNGDLKFNIFTLNCVNYASMGLNKSGVFCIGIHPFILNAQMYLWSNGIRPWSFNPYLDLR